MGGEKGEEKMRYGDKRTASSGVFKHVFNSYPKAKEILCFYNKIPIEQQHCRWCNKGLNKFLQEYRLSRGSNPSKHIDKNAEYVQKDFAPFIKYCQQNLK